MVTDGAAVLGGRGSGGERVAAEAAAVAVKRKRAIELRIGGTVVR